jgi:hypothetical protein
MEPDASNPMKIERETASGDFRRALWRIWPSAAVIGVCTVLAVFGIMDHLLDPDFHPGWYRDERIWWVGLGLAWACAGAAWCRRLFRNVARD